ncbi:hypothetical protein GGI21_000516 [Coemansia aciculifera]|nr:hypothetical protein GGI21_000516 [Coemansia aciculifera]
MRRQDEIRAQEILQKVRMKAAAVERERSARRIQVSHVPVREALPREKGRSVKRSKDLSLVQRARIDTIAHMEMLGAGNRQRPAAQPTRLPANLPPANSLSPGGRVSTTHSRHVSPAVSPAQSPPYYGNSQSYSPPYFSLASSCSPPHSSYSPPYVPELSTSNSGNGLGDSSPGLDFFEDMFGVPSGGAYAKTLPETVVIREQTMLRRRPSATATKRRRTDSELADQTGSKPDAKRNPTTDSTDDVAKMANG